MTTESHLTHLDALRTAAMDALNASQSEEELEQWRVAYLGRRGRLTEVLRGLASLTHDERRTVGAHANQLKALLEDHLKHRRDSLQHTSLEHLAADQIDITLPGRPLPMGRYHPLTIVTREICEVLVGMGFQIMEGPEVEWDLYNFERLNIPKHHPARDQFSTLWVDATHDGEGGYDMLLRTHTSPMQARFMESHPPPVRMISPGKVWRYEATDATHESQFTQIEGLAVDKGVTFANLRYTLDEFARRIFGQERKVRFRCDYFPFVEPGVDLSVDCFACPGDDPSCRVCRGSGWLEIMGAGMVHPNVLRMAGYDPEVYTGFAFGVGPERVAMLKYGIDDMRLFHANDIRFLRQFP
jgi:phenylalanyl-tRNA synthetase alpha chain